MDPRVDRFKRIQAFRVKPERDASITPVLKGFVREQTRLANSLGHVAEAFELTIARDIAAECTLVGLRAGILTIETRSSSVRYALDRALRTGGEVELREEALARGARITKIRVVSA